MHSHDARERFSLADACYRRGQYAEALSILDELNSVYPNTANILFPRARCMRRLGRTKEALHICEVLQNQFNDARAIKLQKAIAKDIAMQREEPVTEEPLMQGLSLDDILGPPPPPPLPAPEPKFGRPDWLSTPVLVAGGVVIGFVAISVLLMLTGGDSGGPGAGGAAQAASAPPEPLFRISDEGKLVFLGWQLTWFGWLAISFIVTTAQYMISLYLTLRVGSKLPHDEFSDNLINVGIMSLIGALMSSVVPCLGLIGSLFILYRTYELTLVEFFILFSFYVATCLVIFGVASFVFFGGLLTMASA